MSTRDETSPLPVGTRVRHYGQQWPRAHRNGTAEILDVKGPYRDGAYEYLVRHDGPFSGGDGPPDDPSWWASYRTIPVHRDTDSNEEN